MKMFRLKAWTGPMQVKEHAELWRKADAIDVLAGTEHVIFDYAGETGDDACYRARSGYERIHGPQLPMSINVIRSL